MTQAPESPRQTWTEQRIVDGLKRGDDDAFEAMIRSYGGRLMSVARRIAYTEEDARDAFQEAMISVHQKIDQFEGSAKLSTWLHRIIVNATLAKMRKQRRRGEVSIEDLLPKYDDRAHRTGPEPATLPTAEQALERQETADLIRRKINELPDEYRIVVMLRDIEEMDTASTAEALGLSTAAVKTRLHRARQALRTLLEQELGHE